MSDFICKRELYHKLGEAYNKGYLSWGANEIIKDIIGECDSVENKGEWIGFDYPYIGNQCSVCRSCFKQSGVDYNFCPNCGARMKGCE